MAKGRAFDALRKAWLEQLAHERRASPHTLRAYGDDAALLTLLYGAGLRLMEALRLRVKDLDLDRREIVVREAKGNKDRVSVVPQCLVPELAASLTKWQAEHAREVERGGGRLQLPTALARKYPALETAWGWQALPAPRPRKHRPAGGEQRGPRRRHREAGNLPHASAFLRDAPPRGRLRHPHRPGVAGAQRRPDDDDLRARAQSWRPADPEPG